MKTRRKKYLDGLYSVYLPGCFEHLFLYIASKGLWECDQTQTVLGVGTQSGGKKQWFLEKGQQKVKAQNADIYKKF